MHSPAIHLDAVDKRFPSGLVSLRQVTLSVGPGEFVSLLGPSGCGKSTVLRMIAGLDRPSAGRIDIAASDRKGDVSFVFQDPALMPWASVFDNVWLPLRLRGLSRADSKQRVEAALSAVDLAGFAGARPAELSGGMKMRASIARALVTQPRVLLMDEPFAALDDITRQRLNLDLLSRWAETPMAVLFVTHSVAEAVFLSQRVLVMSTRPGHVVAEVHVDAPGPRTAGFRSSTVYLSACARLNESLDAAHREDEAAA